MNVTTLIKTLLLGALLCIYSACTPTSGREKITSADAAYKVKQAFPKLSFTRPVDLQHSNDNSNRLFVVEQEGIISVFKNETATSSKKTFLDIQNKVDDNGNEEGLLGLAFHPQYKTNGYFYVNYTATNPDRTVISRFNVSATNPDAADPASEVVLLTFGQPYSNHNGGQVSFGPDGFLYIAVGDGGSGGDPHGNGQNKSAFLGKILRIDVDKQAGGKKYAIPSDNPFAGNKSGYKEEIYAYGMRNPWRLSFDPVTKKLWTGDVGQNAYEEIDIIEKGGNYGWNIMEGKHCYEPKRNCNEEGLKLPVWEYPRKDGVSITGGFVYRGSALPALKGKYIYADYGSGNIWALDATSYFNILLVESNLNIASFGIDPQNELYICAFDGKIYTLSN
jgi:glucose/arabinose dehydrogenase